MHLCFILDYLYSNSLYLPSYNKSAFSPHHCYFLLAFYRFYTSFVSLAMFAVVYGVAGGVSQNLFTVITIDLLGIQNLAKTMSFVYIINSAFTSLNHPLIGEARLRW